MTAHPLNLIPAWQDIGAVADIPERGSRRVHTAQGAVAVFRTSDGSVFALLDRCPHKQGPLSQGIVHGHGVTCPLHSWIIDLATGQPTGANSGKGCVPTVPVLIVEGRVMLDARLPAMAA